ncbi:MAG: virginiamycin lyase [Solirubrobacteraceae bacterium]|jgi:streptogramin lyase|nr:virginiamycin lyase [Solirubrobacteraceae bacterium]
MRLLVAILVLVVGLAAPAAAATPTAREFSTGITAASSPDGIVAGSDGNLWFAEVNGDRIGRVTPSGQVTEFNATGFGKPGGIAAGPDGNVWFTESNATSTKGIAFITPSGLMDETTFTTATASTLNGITAGPDGNLWFADGGQRVGRISPAASPPTLSTSGITGSPDEIVTGADGNVWFTEKASPGKVARVDPDTFPSAATEFAITGEPNGIAAGPDGKVWFTQNSPDAIGRIDPNAPTPATTITYFTTGLNSIPLGIAAGPDGNLWFAELGDAIGRITPAGVITEFSAGINSPASPSGIAAGPDGNLWFTEFFAQRIGRMNTALDPPRFTDRARIEVPASLAGTQGPAEPYPATIEVSGLQGAVTDVNVRLNGLHHPVADDVEALLVGPQGQKVLLTADSTGMGRDVVTGPVITFDDEGLTSPLRLVSGIFKPIDGFADPSLGPPAPPAPYGTALAAFDGTDPAGTWQLFVWDDSGAAATGGGALAGGWSLDVQTAGPPPAQVPGPPVEVRVPGPTTTVTAPGPAVGAPADTTRPGLRLSGPTSRTTQTAFRAGPKITVTPSEPVTLDVTLSAKPRTVTIADTDALLLFDRTIRATGATSIRLKPATRLLGRPKKAFPATLRIVASDDAGNRTTVTRTITVAPDRRIRRARR